jgi:hypothetical protein
MKRSYERAVRDREYFLRRRFGIGLREYASMLVAQGGVCAICGLPERTPAGVTRRRRALSVDHCHATGKIRGLLCLACNAAIGLLDDSPDQALALAAYLERHGEGAG